MRPCNYEEDFLRDEILKNSAPKKRAPTRRSGISIKRDWPPDCGPRAKQDSHHVSKLFDLLIILRNRIFMFLILNKFIIP